MKIHPKLKSAARIVGVLAVLFGLVYCASKVLYTSVPPERLAVSEMLALGSVAKTAIAETFANRGTLEGATSELLPPAQDIGPNSKGPFEWMLERDGTLTGRSARWNVTVVYRTQDQGLNWTCQVTPLEFAPRVGICANAP